MSPSSLHGFYHTYTPHEIKVSIQLQSLHAEVWNHVLCNINKVLGEKGAKQRFGRLFTTKELYGVVQETRGSIVSIYASPITIQVHVHVVHFRGVAVPKASSVCSTDKANCIAWLDVGNCLAKPGPVVVTIFWHCYMDLLTLL